MLRDELDYPENIKLKNQYVTSLRYRENISAGYKVMDYSCLEWTETNAASIPMKSEISIWMYPYTNAPAVVASLWVETVDLYDKTRDVLEHSAALYIVKDYRYKRSNSSRIYKYAKYTLPAGAPWKTETDPLLLQAAREFLKHGPRYDHYDYGKTQFLAWAIGFCLIAAPVLFMLIAKRKQMNISK